VRVNHSPQRINPFPGLRAFTQDEDFLFFGREEQTLELLQRLGDHRFVAVVGTSGSGKSSLVRCGLLSELLGGRMLAAGAAWEIAVTHPGGNPLGLLSEALVAADLYDREAENIRENLLATLSRSHFGLVEAVKQAGLGPGTNFLLVVDQFEEIFRFHEAGPTQQERAGEFVSLLLEATAQKEVPIFVVLTMRSDFIGECGQFEGLAEAVNRGEFLIPRLTREQYKRVIEGPIRVAGGQIAPRLLQRLLNDLGQQADQLPCLQHALMRTWNVWAEKGGADALDLEDYHQVGRMSEALSLHADEVFDSLAGDRQRELCTGVFKALTVQETENRGIRRPQRLGRLCQILDVPAEDLLPILDAYRRPGVTFLMPSHDVELTDRTIIDISHESLMRVWTRLRHWVDDESHAVGIYRRLSESAVLYKQNKAGLYRDPELGIALAWRDASHPNEAWAERYHPGFVPAMEFLDASKSARDVEEQAQEAARQRELEQARMLAEAERARAETETRAARRLRKLIAGLAVVAVIAAVACAIALFANQRANTLAEKARQSQQETAKALATVETEKAEVEGSLSKAESAERLARDAEEAGRKLQYTTDMQLAPFVWRDDRTSAEQLLAVLARHIPDSQAAIAKPDLRGFEWYYYQNMLEHNSAVFSGHAAAVVGRALDPDGQLVTLDALGQVRRWNLGTQTEDTAKRRDLPGGRGTPIWILSPNGKRAAQAESNKVHVFDTATGQEKFQIDSAYKGRLIFSRDNDWLVVVDDRIRWLNTSGEEIAALKPGFKVVNYLALSADGLTLAAVGHGNGFMQFSIFRLDATERKVIPPANGFVSLGVTLRAAALSPDGGRIAVCSIFSGEFFVHDTATGRRIAQHLTAHASSIGALAFADDGIRLATADNKGTIKIWADASKLNSKSTALMTLKGHHGEVTAVGFSRDGKRLITSSADKTARVWNLENPGATTRRLEGSAFSRVVRFSPDGLLIAVATGSRVRLWDGATGRLAREMPLSDTKGSIHSVAFSPTDNRLLAVGFDGQPGESCVALWDIDAGREFARLPGAAEFPELPKDANARAVAAIAFSPDGKYLVAGFGNKANFVSTRFASPLAVWEIGTRRLVRRLNGHKGYCLSLDFSRDGKLLASGSRDGKAILWSTVTWQPVQTLINPDKNSSGGQGLIEDVAFSPDGKTLAMASREQGGKVLLWNVADGDLVATLKGHSNAVNAVAFSPDGHTLASGSSDETVRLWNVETRRELMQLDPGSIGLGEVRTLAFSPDGNRLLAGGQAPPALWSTTPVAWNDPQRTTEGRPQQANTDFRSRIVAARIADIYAAAHDWERAIAAYQRLLADQPADIAVLTKLITTYMSAGRTREAVPYMEKLSVANPTDTELWIDLAAWQAWFGQAQELAATRQRVLALAKGTSDMLTAERAAKVCTIVPSTDKVELEAGLALARKAVELGKGGNWNLLALGISEYRSGHDAAAAEALRSATAGPTNHFVAGTAGFFRAMSVYRLGKPDEARKVAIEAVAEMKPLPNPSLDIPYLRDDLVLWLAYKEAKAMIKFDEAPPPAAEGNQN
jgi:WD40 repeat protein